MKYRHFVTAALAVAASACTVDVQVPPPNVTVECVIIELPGGQTSTECPDAGGDAGAGDDAPGTVVGHAPGTDR